MTPLPIKNATRFNKEQVSQYSGPIVYVIWGANTVIPLYIGMSKFGLGRLFNVNHPCQTMSDSIENLDIILCSSAQEAFDKESELIRDMQPKYNKEPRNGHIRVKSTQEKMLYEIRRRKRLREREEGR